MGGERACAGRVIKFHGVLRLISSSGMRFKV
jgi:hypothetical protein